MSQFHRKLEYFLIIAIPFKKGFPQALQKRTANHNKGLQGNYEAAR